MRLFCHRDHRGLREDLSETSVTKSEFITEKGIMNNHNDNHKTDQQAENNPLMAVYNAQPPLPAPPLYWLQPASAWYWPQLAPAREQRQR